MSIGLRPATVAHIEALIAGDEVFAAEFGLKVIPGYLAFPEALEHMRKGLAEGLDPNWSSHLIIAPIAGELVGLFPGGRVPDAHGAVLAAAGEQFAVRCVSERRDAVRVTVQRLPFSHAVPSPRGSTPAPDARAGSPPSVAWRPAVPPARPAPGAAPPPPA